MDLTDGILDYLKMESTGALMVSGEWGCGKTYHIKHVVLPSLKEHGYNPVMVSLFGISNVNEIPLRIIENYQAEDTGKKKHWFCWGKEKAGKLAAKGSGLLSSISWLSNFVDVKTLIERHSELLYKLMTTEKTIMLLDDIERVIDTIDIHSLLGAINGLVEQRGYKVVVIANNSYIHQKGEDKLVFKEKVIEKTLVYEPDVVPIFKELCGTQKYQQNFVHFMGREDVLRIIDPKTPVYSEDKSLQKELSNIRILKFALSHYHGLFDAYREILKDEDEHLTTPFLLSLWANTIGLAIEYKKGRLTYRDRDEYAGYIDVALANWDLDLEGVASESMADESNLEEQNRENLRRSNAQLRVSYMIDSFVKAHNLPVVIVPQLFYFVTAGISMDEAILRQIWERFKDDALRNTISPACELLDRFMKAPWSMSNAEVRCALGQLLQYVEEGQFGDNMAYVNCATYLQHLQVLTEFSMAEIQDKIKKGIDKMYEGITNLRILDKLNLDVLEAEIPQESRWVVDYERKKMEEFTTKSRETDIKEVCRQFNEDLPTLATRLTRQHDDTKSPEFLDFPILAHIPATDIVKKVNEIKPKEVMALCYILHRRFLQMVNPKVYDGELVFVKNLKQTISQRKVDKREYVDILIEDHLQKIVNKILKSK